MARYVKEIPAADSQLNSFGRIKQYLTEKGFEYRVRDGEQVFQKGKGVWVVPGFIKVTYHGTMVRVEAWTDINGSEQDLEGFVGSAAKKPLKKHVAQVEAILAERNPDYIPAPAVAQYCMQCGTRIIDGGNFCMQCGSPAVIPATQAVTPMNSRAASIPADVTRKKYFREYAGDGFNSNIRVIAICAYVMCGLLAVTAIMNPYSLIDALAFFVLTLGMHLRKSEGCAIVILAYSVVGFIFALVYSHSVVGVGWIVIGIYSVMAFHSAGKRWKQRVQKQ